MGRTRMKFTHEHKHTRGRGDFREGRENTQRAVRSGVQGDERDQSSPLLNHVATTNYLIGYYHLTDMRMREPSL